MAKKKAKKKSARKVREKADEECVALIREYFKRNGVEPHEHDINGAHAFVDMFETVESVLSSVKIMVAVGKKGATAVCEIPIRVPKSRIPEVLKFINHMNSEELDCGMLVLDPKENTVSVRNDCHASVIKSDVDSAMKEFFETMVAQVGVCGDRILEIISGGSLTELQDDNEADVSAKEPDTNTKNAEEAKRELKVPMAPKALASEYSLDGLGVRSEVPLDRIVAAVARFHKTHRSSEVVPRLSILISGPSGCGKTEFVKYLGERTGTEVIAVTASDVLRSLVGETEQRIADVFREASEKHAILFLDEVDSLLFNRKNAHYAWERVQTNELLQQMERFTGVLVCATNLVEQLDSAVMRRFTFKVQMSALDDDGKLKFFSRYFKSNLTAEERRRLLSIPNLTPGDFRTVRERLYFLRKNRGVDNARRIAALEVESKAKEASRMPIGFG